jgi:hypothetical protein
VSARVGVTALLLVLVFGGLGLGLVGAWPWGSTP